ncbi:MAG: bifunctional folylpolyglutamate synthase/dihydrofolate synthase [Ruminococcus sp.]|nr:bifunctional folylpolyglutamate synthase/dihydrofolate synthase [Ruminococcus sp.]
MNCGQGYINSFSHSGKPVKDLSRARALMSALGDPQDELKIIHIAGTNGKGSISQMLSEICQDAGLKTGSFTSPYIFRYNDRIKVNGEDIPDDALDRLAERVRNAVEASPYKAEFSQFEITMAVAFLYFQETDCDIVILEAGLGGLLDCTNIVKRPLACVIGSVSFDHTQVLGETLSEIAYQKAGIIKSGTPCILSAGAADEVVKIFNDKAAAEKSDLIIPNGALSVISADIRGSDFIYRSQRYHISMQGEHMIRNALSAIECMSTIGDKLGITVDNMKRGLSKAVVPARVQVLSEHPLLIVDGAHNEDSMRALAKAVKASGVTPVNVIAGMCKDKNMRSALKELAKAADKFYTCDGFDPRAESAKALAELITELDVPAEPCDMNALDKAHQLMKQQPNSLTLICGSLYLCSQILNDIAKM